MSRIKLMIYIYMGYYMELYMNCNSCMMSMMSMMSIGRWLRASYRIAQPDGAQ